jgi:hypothetical protein
MHASVPYKIVCEIRASQAEGWVRAILQEIKFAARKEELELDVMVPTTIVDQICLTLMSKTYSYKVSKYNHLSSDDKSQARICINWDRTP